MQSLSVFFSTANIIENSAANLSLHDVILFRKMQAGTTLPAEILKIIEQERRAGQGALQLLSAGKMLWVSRQKNSAIGAFVTVDAF